MQTLRDPCPGAPRHRTPPRGPTRPRSRCTPRARWRPSLRPTARTGGSGPRRRFAPLAQPRCRCTATSRGKDVAFNATVPAGIRPPPSLHPASSRLAARSPARAAGAASVSAPRLGGPRRASPPAGRRAGARRPGRTAPPAPHPMAGPSSSRTPPGPRRRRAAAPRRCRRSGAAGGQPCWRRLGGAERSGAPQEGPPAGPEGPQRALEPVALSRRAAPRRRHGEVVRQLHVQEGLPPRLQVQHQKGERRSGAFRPRLRAPGLLRPSPFPGSSPAWRGVASCCPSLPSVPARRPLPAAPGTQRCGIRASFSLRVTQLPRLCSQMLKF